MVFRGRGLTSGGQEHESVFSAAVHKIWTRKCYIESFPLFSSRGKIRCTVVFWLCLPSGSTCSILIDIRKSSVCTYTCTCIGFMLYVKKCDLCELTWINVMWYCLSLWAHVNQCHVILFELVSSCDVMWYCLSSCDVMCVVILFELMWCRVSCDIVWAHVMSCDVVILFELMWCHVISCGVVSSWYRVITWFMC